MSGKPQLKVGFVGTGYIAQYHAEAVAALPDARLVAVCDLNGGRARSFANKHDVPGVYESAERMLENERLDVVHVLTPPDQHYAVGHLLLDSGAHLLLEKPMCSEAAGCDGLLTKAERRNRRLGVSHNFLFHPAYELLRNDIRQGHLGPLDQICVTWALELPQIKAGPFDAWVLRHPANILFEIGSHCLSLVLDLVEPPEDIAVRGIDAVTLPTGTAFCRRWEISAWCGRTAVHLHFAFAPGYPERSVSVRGPLGRATADLERNTYLLQRAGCRGGDLGKYDAIVGAARGLRLQASRNLRNYVLSKLGVSKEGNSFKTSVNRCVQAFYAGLSGTMDPRCSGQLGRQVIEQCARIAGLAGGQQAPPARILKMSKGLHGPADVVVLGGTGFIGRELVRQLLRAGRSVRVMTRSHGSIPFEVDQPGLQIVAGDMCNENDLAEAVRDTHTVFHLARLSGGTWEDYYRQDVLGTRCLAELCLKRRVQRLVYTGSIVTYNLAGRSPITEQTRFDAAVLRQNKYARAKAMAEQVLRALHESSGLPVVIVRPGMVIGRGGELCHAGVGAWNGPGVCVFWGDGKGPLPLVLVEDVARGLVTAAEREGIEGESFNLVDNPCLSARDYVAEIERFAGLRIQTYEGSLRRAFAVDLCKWGAKWVLRMPDRYVPRYRMWKARSATAVFDCSKAREVLGWQPASDRDTIVTRGIHVHLVESAGAVSLEPAHTSETGKSHDRYQSDD